MNTNIKYNLSYLYSIMLLTILLAGCNETLMNDGVYYSEVRNYHLMDNKNSLLRSTFEDFEKLEELDSLANYKLNILVNDKKYYTKSDLISCYINGCFFIIKDHKIQKKLFVGCNYCKFNGSTLTEEGQSLLDSILITIQKK